MTREQDRALFAELPFRLVGAALNGIGRLSPRAAGEVAGALMTRPRRHPRPDREEALLSRASSFVLRSDAGQRIRGWSVGRGETVLLVHGWEGRGAQLGAMAEPLREAGFRAVFFDGPAHGESEGLVGGAPELAGAIRALSKEEGPFRAVVAHSMGGMAAMAARRGGVRAKGWVVLGSPSSPLGGVRFMREKLRLDAAVVDALEARLSRQVDMERGALMRGALYADGGEPLLVVQDEEDEDVPAHHAHTIAQWWGSHARIHLTEGLGHRKILWNQEVIEEIVGFVRSLGSAESASASAPL